MQTFNVHLKTDTHIVYFSPLSACTNMSASSLQKERFWVVFLPMAAQCRRRSVHKLRFWARWRAVGLGVFSRSLVGFKEYLVCICLPIHTSHIPKQWET